MHRFNEADKWFACATFENAMLTEQARKTHFSPSSELTFEVCRTLLIGLHFKMLGGSTKYFSASLKRQALRMVEGRMFILIAHCELAGNLHAF